MSDVLHRDDVRAFLEVGPGMRSKLERALDALMDLLDGLDDPDLEDGELEPDADMEASLGAPNEGRSQERWGEGTPTNGWDADREGPEDDLEPSLAAPERHPIVPHPIYHRHGEYTSHDLQDDQRDWAAGGTANDECEKEDEHGGDILNEPHDEEEKELELGATTAINQEHAWRALRPSWAVTDGEPSLGWPDSPPGRGHPGSVTHNRAYDDDREQDIADQPHDEQAEGGGDLPTLNQAAEAGPGNIGAITADVAREQVAMRNAATRLREIVAKVRGLGDPARPGAGQAYVDLYAMEGRYEFVRFDEL